MWGGRPDWRAVFPTPIPYAELQGGVEFAFIPGAAGLPDGGLPASRILVQVGRRGEEGLLAEHPDLWYYGRNAADEGGLFTVKRTLA